MPLDGNYQEMLKDREACWRSLRPPLSWADVPDKHPHVPEVLPQTEVERGRKTEEPSSSMTSEFMSPPEPNEVLQLT